MAKAMQERSMASGHDPNHDGDDDDDDLPLKQESS